MSGNNKNENKEKAQRILAGFGIAWKIVMIVIALAALTVLIAVGVRIILWLKGG